MKKKLVVSIVLLVLGVSLALIAYTSAKGIGFLSPIGSKISEIKSNDKIIAKVNGKPIYYSEIATWYLFKKAGYEIEKKYLPDSLLENSDPMNVLNEHIDSILLFQYAKEKGYEVDKAYYEELLKSAKDSFNSIVSGKFSPDENLDPLSKEESEKFMPIAKDIITQTGLSYEECFNKIVVPGLEESARLQTLKKDIMDSINVVSSPEEIRSYLQKYPGNILFEQIVYDTREELGKDKELFESSPHPESEMLEKILTLHNNENPYKSIKFNTLSELPSYLKNAMDNSKQGFYFGISEEKGKYYLIYFMKISMPVTHDEAVSKIKQDKLRNAVDEKIGQLKADLRRSAKIEIVDKKAIEDLTNINP